ncbi:hypothetical protein [Bradyrhizobium algeriense]|uniref:hypothetical protein n=1 Tax=Bradyrhizobium algeriense TaxID=634784 RepID=UPI0011AEA51F|nr:hypothetical protein [Bradyrhizobium algeriense]
MDRDHPQTPEGADDDSRRAEGMGHLPVDPLAEVARRLLTDDPIETAKSLTNFKLVSRSMRQAIETPALATFERRLSDVAGLGRIVNHLAIPPGGLSQFDNVPLTEEEAQGFSYPSCRAKVASPTVKFEGNARRSAFVDDILNLSPFQQAMSLHSIARDLAGLDRVNTNRLVRRAIELFEQDGNPPVVRRFAAAALVRGHKHLDADHKVQIFDAIVARPDLFSDYGHEARIEHASTVASLASRSAASSRNTAESHNPDLDSEINRIYTRMHDLGNGPNTNNMSERELVEGLRPLGRSISKAYDSARAALMASDRSRERSSLAR